MYNSKAFLPPVTLRCEVVDYIFLPRVPNPEEDGKVCGKNYTIQDSTPARLSTEERCLSVTPGFDSRSGRLGSQHSKINVNTKFEVII